MAETRRVSPAVPYPAPRRAAPRPRLPHPTATRKEPARLPVREEESVPPIPASRPEPRPPAAPRIAQPVAATPPRTKTERTVLTVLVLGLVLNALALLRNAALTRADALLGATVLLAGISLLVLMEVFRRARR
jgi:hypothetical protein